jgi:hypothetical protein
VYTTVPEVHLTCIESAAARRLDTGITQCVDPAGGPAPAYRRRRPAAAAPSRLMTNVITLGRHQMVLAAAYPPLRYAEAARALSSPTRPI